MTNSWIVYLVLLLFGGVHIINSSLIGKHKAVDVLEVGAHSGRDVTFDSDVTGFEKIEEYLQEHVDNEDIQSNMDAVKDLLIEQLYKPVGVVDKKLLSALEMFVNMEKLTKHTTCNHYGHDFLTKLKAATKYRIDQRTTKRRRLFLPLRRIELLMSEFALIHAQRCQVVYRYHFAHLMSEYNRSRLDSIDAFINLMINHRVKQNTKAEADTYYERAKLRRAYANLIDKNDSLKRQEDAKLTLNFMMSTSGDQFINLSKDELEGRVRAWFRGHLIRPCENYLNTMAKDVFMPAEFDSRVSDKADKIKPVVDEQRDGFIYGWARYGVCRILERDQDILIKNVMFLLNSRHNAEHD